MTRSRSVWKLRVALRIWGYAAHASFLVRTQALPEVVHRYSRRGRRRPVPVARLSRAVNRSLKLGRWQPRCLIRALVLHRLLSEQGNRPELVIGLPEAPKDHAAHAWVELEGVDVGPPPGKGLHSELARYS